MKICIVTPAGPQLRNGNRVTAVRWSRFLRQLVEKVLLEESWGGEEPDLMIALHARRSHPSIRRHRMPRASLYSGSHRHRPLPGHTL